VIATGFYHISSQSIIDTYGYIYQDSFDPFNPSVNLILENDQSCPDEQFKLTVNLQVDIKYILVVTTALPDVTGEFSILVSGPTNFSLEHISKHFYYFFDSYQISLKYRNGRYIQFQLYICMMF
jgi:hypothetical protein